MSAMGSYIAVSFLSLSLPGARVSPSSHSFSSRQSATKNIELICDNIIQSGRLTSAESLRIGLIAYRSVFLKRSVPSSPSSCLDRSPSLALSTARIPVTGTTHRKTTRT